MASAAQRKSRGGRGGSHPTKRIKRSPREETTWKDKLTWYKEFPVIGNGTFIFNITRSTPFYIRVTNTPCDAAPESAPLSPSWIDLQVNRKIVAFNDHMDGETKHRCVVKDADLDEGADLFETVGVEEGYTCSYWLSYDRDRMVVKYGKGYRMTKTTLMEYDYYKIKEDKEKEKIRNALFNPEVDRWIEFYDQKDGSRLHHSLASVDKKVDFDPMPLVSDLPYLVKSSSEVNLFDLDIGKYLFSASLPRECQTLYDNVTAKDVDLDYQGTDSNNQYSFKLTDAIRYSIETEGCSLFQKLIDKADEFGDDRNETYLRVTLGKNYGQSPGIPYMLEIWPKGKRSPIHDHGNAYAVIRVLHGGITVKYFNKLSVRESEDADKPDCPGDHKKIGQFNAKKGDATWIAPNWYQTHQLRNDTDDYCATVQCYMYGTNDNMHWPYFDYIKNTGTCSAIMDEFTPDSDFTFTEMFNTVMTEYANRHQPKLQLK